MNIRAECSNPKCTACGVEKSIAVGQMLGYGASLPGSYEHVKGIFFEHLANKLHYGRVRALRFVPLDIPHESLIHSSI